MVKNEHEYGTSDFPLAASLLALGAVYVGIDRSDPGRAVFYFKQDESLVRAVEAFWLGRLLVEPQGLFNAQKTLKSRLYDSRP